MALNVLFILILLFYIFSFSIIPIGSLILTIISFKKAWAYWIKGLLIGVLVGSLLFTILFLGILFTCDGEGCMALGIAFILGVILFLISIFIGSIIGIIVGCIKPKNKYKASAVSKGSDKSLSKKEEKFKAIDLNKGKQSFFEQLGTAGKVFIVLAAVFFVLQLISRPFIGAGATFFGVLGGVSTAIVLIIYFKNKAL